MSTIVQFNNVYFDNILRTAGIQKMQAEVAERALAIAKANAPVDSGDYRNGLKVVKAERGYRTAYLVVGTDRKTLLVESRTGNLARALKSAGRR